MKTRILIPTTDGQKYAFGTVAWLYIGEVKTKFLIQNNGRLNAHLTHFSSGLKFGNLVNIKLMHINFNLSDRDAAKLLIEKVINRIGLNKVLDGLINATILNGEK